MIQPIIINPTPTVSIIKIKNNKPTVIEYDGNRYTLQHPDQFKRGGHSEKGNKR